MTENENMNMNNGEAQETEKGFLSSTKEKIVGAAVLVGTGIGVAIGKPIYDDYKAAKKEKVPFKKKRLERKLAKVKKINNKSRSVFDDQEAKLQKEIDSFTPTDEHSDATGEKKE